MKIWKMLLAMVCTLMLIAFVETLDDVPVVVLNSPWMDRSFNENLIVTYYYEPYITKERDGIMDILMDETVELAGLDVVYAYYPWTRCLAMVEHGYAMGTYAWAYTEARSKLFTFSDILYPVEEAFFYLDSRYDDMTPEEILSDSETTFGLMDAYYHMELLKPVNPDVSTMETNALDKLFNQRIDGIMLSKFNGLYLINLHHPNQLSEVKYKTGFMEILPLRLMVSNKRVQSFRFREDFNNGLHALVESGRYDALVKAFEESLYE